MSRNITPERALEIIQRKTSIPNDSESYAEISEAYDLAIELLTALAQKRLVELPCAIGDEVYTVEENVQPCCEDGEACIHSNGSRYSIMEAYDCDYICPPRYYIRPHKCEAFVVESTEKPLSLGDAGVIGYEGLETFYSYCGHYRTYEEAKAALLRKDPHAIIEGGDTN